MFIFAITLGIYAYTFFFLGILGFLYKDTIIWFTLSYWLVFILWRRKGLSRLLSDGYRFLLRVSKGKLFMTLLILFFAQILVNLMGALGPELAFDALWYHLTLPKIWLLNHTISFIPGGLLYYSAMPKLGELLFIPALTIGNEILAKCLQLCFGLLCCIALYRLQRKFFTPVISLIGVIIFYANLVVGWESITAYVDLIRTFFEIIALWGFILWSQEQRKKWLILSACMLGFAITTKLLAIGSLFIFCVLLIWVFWKERKNWFTLIQYEISFVCMALLIPSPWFIFSYLQTGNMVYPFFTDIYRVTPEPLSLVGFFVETWIVLTRADDPISPIYLILLPLIIIFLYQSRKKSQEQILIGIYSLAAIIVWYFTPRTGGGRFLMPYLPAFSILCVYIYSQILKKTRIEFVYLQRFLLGLIIFVSIISIGYRFVANYKYLPVILGKQTKQAFLTNHLNFAFGDFYDSDNFLKNHISDQDKVVLYGFHNLYYVEFPFVDSTWIQKEQQFNYIATQNTLLPNEYKAWKLVYTNNKTMLKLYSKPK